MKGLLLVLIAALLVGCADFDPFSPMRGVLFIRGGGLDNRVHVIEAFDGTTRVVDLTGSAFTEYDPAWSPDGSRIAWVRFDSGLPRHELWTADPDGGNAKLVFSDPMAMADPAWSADEIAFAWKPGSFFEIHRVPAEGGTPSDLIDASPLYDESDPTWYEGSILFTVGVSANADIYRTDAGSGTSAPFIALPGTAQAGPAWSPDGRRVAYSSAETGDPEIWVARADGGGRMRLTFLAGDDLHPSWSPDGRLIVWQHDVSTASAIWVMNADGSDQRLLADAPALLDVTPSW